MERKALRLLREWHVKTNRKPLILRGARQVGKSTLVRIFAKDQSLELIEVNLERTRVGSLDSDEIEVEKIFREIEYLTQKRITKKSRRTNRGAANKKYGTGTICAGFEPRPAGATPEN